ncbi:hypothetical protein NX059_005847 [Plenodomus lindquistii]|nr:hypothetical protein NX059_005847 [Plenodomus lindquistii]
MRASVFIASFVALAASSPVNVPVLGEVKIPEAAGITHKPVDKVLKRQQLPELPTSLPLDVVSNLPIDISKLPVDLSSLPADVLSLVDLSKLPVDVTGLPTDVLNLIGDLLNLVDVSKLPVNVANLPADVLDIVGDVTEILDLSKIPVDVSKLPVLSSTKILSRDLGHAIDPPSKRQSAIDPNNVSYGPPGGKREILGLPVLPSITLPEAKKVDIENVLTQVTGLLTDLLESDALPIKGLGVEQSTTDAVGVPLLDTIELAATLKAVLSIVTGLLG